MAKLKTYNVLVAGHPDAIEIDADEVKHLPDPFVQMAAGDWQFFIEGNEVARFARPSVMGFWVD